MNADAFLALVERHPPPWEEDREDIYCNTFFRNKECERAIGYDAAAVAFPALAAAAIRLLRDSFPAMIDDRAASEPRKVGRVVSDELITALCAALPEEMRP